MAGSRCPSLLGTDSLELDPEYIPARTPGPMGTLDAADPDTGGLGDTPGPLGIGDYADPSARSFLIPPLDYHRVVAYQIFEESVEGAHIKRAAKRRTHAPDIPESELETVEGPYKLIRPVAAKCRALLKQARADLASEKAAFVKKAIQDQHAEELKLKASGETPATTVESIGISSAYRGVKHDRELWEHYFQDKYYPANYSQLRRISCWDGGQFGGKAVRAMVDFVSKRKAAPGFSNHSNGIAVDFFTVEGGVTLQANTKGTSADLKKVNAHWEKSWLYRWLEKHKREYGIERIPTEAWHWEFHQ